jgi:hypothetical protein
VEDEQGMATVGWPVLEDEDFVAQDADAAAAGLPGFKRWSKGVAHGRTSLPSIKRPQPAAEVAGKALNKAVLTRMKKVILPDDTWHEELAEAPNIEFA